MRQAFGAIALLQRFSARITLAVLLTLALALPSQAAGGKYAAIVVDGVAHPLSASIGVSFFPQADEASADQLLRQADRATLAEVAGKARQLQKTSATDNIVAACEELAR